MRDEKLKILKENLIDQYNKNKEEYANEINQELLSQVNQNEEPKIIIEDIFSPNFGLTSDIVEIENIGLKRFVDIDFTNIDIKKNEYECLLDNIDIVIKSENRSDIDYAIDNIVEVKDKAIKVIYNQSRRFNFNNEIQKRNLSFLMYNLSIKSLYARDIALAVLKQANSKSHLKLAIMTAGEIKDSQASEHIIRSLKEEELFKLSVESLIKIGDLNSLDIILDCIEAVKLEDSNKLEFFNYISKEFINFGPSVITKVLSKYNECTKYWIRPIYSKILESFKGDLTPILMEIIENKSDYAELKHIFILLGKMRIEPAINFLINVFETDDDKKRLAVTALGYCKSEQSIELLEKVLEEGEENIEILREAILSLSYIGNKSTSVKVFKKYTDSFDEQLKIFSIFSLARYNYKEYLDKLVDYIVNGNEKQINIIERIISRLFRKQVIYIAEKLLNFETEQSIMNILKILKRIKILPRETGTIFIQLLNEDIPSVVKIEIYQMISKVANTPNEILPQSVIFNALEKATTQNEKNQLYAIVNSMPRIMSRISSK